MAQENKNEQGGNKSSETLEERLRRIEAEAAKKRSAVSTQKNTSAAEKQPENSTPPAPEEKEQKQETSRNNQRSRPKPQNENKEKSARTQNKSSVQADEKKTGPQSKNALNEQSASKEDAEATKTEKKKPTSRRKPAKKTEDPPASEKAASSSSQKPEQPTAKADEKSEPTKKTARRSTRKKAAPKTEQDDKTAGNSKQSGVADADKSPSQKRQTTKSDNAKSGNSKRTSAKAAKPDTDNKTAPKKNTRSSSSRSKKTSEKNTPAKSSGGRGKSRTSAADNKTTAKKKPATRKKAPTRTVTADSDKELIINSTPTQVEIALMENGKLVELHHQKTNNNFTVGDIFLGRVKRLMPGLNAAFVDIGHKKDAFLHYTDLGPKLKSLLKYTAGVTSGKTDTYSLDNFTLEKEIIKTGKIDQVLNKRELILVQVLKEPIGTKGPRLSCEITIPGRFLVLTPFVDVIAVSKKIGNSEERKRLKMLIESIKPKNFGVIVRTAAEGKKVQDLHEELKLMMDKWESIYGQLKNAQPPMKLLSELDKTSSILRDVLNDSFNSVVVNDQELYNNVRTYMSSFAPKKTDIIKMHKSRKPIFDVYDVTKQIKSGFGKTATMPSGSYLVIEHTEAMHVIDVNSGHKMSSADQEAAVLAVNMESAEEIARQMRLRDIGGIIIVDFIDMRNKEHKQKLVTAMRQFMKKDRAQHTVLPLSKFGLMQITRQRVRPEVKINTAEVCPSCNGTGKINPSILLTDDLERDLKFILQSRPKSKLILTVHPYIEAYLKKGIPSIQMKWYMKFYKWIKIRANADYSMTAYKFHDGNEDEIRLK